MSKSGQRITILLPFQGNPITHVWLPASGQLTDLMIVRGPGLLVQQYDVCVVAARLGLSSALVRFLGVVPAVPGVVTYVCRVPGGSWSYEGYVKTAVADAASSLWAPPLIETMQRRLSQS